MREVRREYTRKFRVTKKDMWEGYLSNLSEENVWSAHRITNNEHSDGGRSRIPNLKTTLEDGSVRELETDGEKSKAFFADFFVEGSSRGTPNTLYPEPKFKFRSITN